MQIQKQHARVNALAIVNDVDASHERRIRLCYERWMNDEATWSELTALLNARSKEQVKKMERAQGLL